MVSVWSLRQPTNPEAKGAGRRFTEGFLSATAAISRPWLLAALWLIAWFLATSITNPEPLNFLRLTTPLLTALIGALSLNGFCNSIQAPARMSSAVEGSHANTNRWRKELIILLLAAVCWEAMSFWMNERLYAGLLVPHGDSAMYEEHLWNVWHGKGFRSYLDQGLFLGEHIQIIHLLLLPLHRIWPSYLMMELLASCSLAICVVPIFSIAKRHSGSAGAAMWLGLAWLFFFPMHFLDIAIDLKTLRPSCYGLPFLFWGIDFAERRRLISSSICFLIALTTQEDFALVVGSIGAVLFLTSRRNPEAASPDDAKRFTRWTVGLVCFSVIWVLLAVLVVIPAFRGGSAVHYSRYFGDLGNSPGDLFRTALRSPGRVAVSASEPENAVLRPCSDGADRSESPEATNVPDWRCRHILHVKPDSARKQYRNDECVRTVRITTDSVSSFSRSIAAGTLLGCSGRSECDERCQFRPTRIFLCCSDSCHGLAHAGRIDVLVERFHPSAGKSSMFPAKGCRNSKKSWRCCQSIHAWLRLTMSTRD